LLQQSVVQAVAASPVAQVEPSVVHAKTVMDAEVGGKPTAGADVDVGADAAAD
jgi:hypothetical protein